MATIDSLTSLLNRSPASYALEQLRKLALRVYPYFVPDFAHLGDVQIALTEIDAKLAALATLIATHVHVVLPVPPLGLAAAPSGFLSPIVPTIITNAVGLGLVDPIGTPQPTGEGPPLLAPARRATPMELVAIPPISPADLV